MDEDRRLPAERFIDIDMFWHRREPFVATDHMGDLHEIVIDNAGEVVGGEAIAFHEDLIIDIGPGDGDSAFDGIFEDAFAAQRYF